MSEPLTTLLALLVPALGRALLHFLWQGALIGLIAAVLLHALRNARPQARYAVACVAMLACALAPIADIVWFLLQDAEVATSIAPAGAASLTAASPTIALPVIATATVGLASRIDAALPWIVAFWACGACVLSLRMATGVWWIQRLCATPQATAQAAWQARLDALSARFALAKPIALRLVDSLATPAVVGWFRPVVLLPVALINRMPVDLLEALLAHELAHIRRHDYLLNLLQGAVEAMLFYHPVTWWLSRRIRSEREHIADQLAAQVIGEPRRLALALSELSEFVASHTTPSFATPSLALTAHGGPLMSRIEQLVRPGLQRRSGRIAFPLIGLAAACLAFYAHAQIDREAPAAASAKSASAKAAATSAVAKANGEKGHVRLHEPYAGPTYALVRKGHDGFTMSGSTDYIDDIKAVRSRMGSDFLWFRKGDQAYVVVDPATLDRATKAWAETNKLDARMEALDAQMEVHSHKMDALSAQMDKLSDGGESPAMEAAAKRMKELGGQQGALGARQAELATAMINANEAQQDKLSREMDALSAQQDALSEQMDAQSRVMDAESERMEEQAKPMEALGRQMEEAGKPMEALGKQMDELGEQMDRLSEQAERETLRLIDDAVAKGLAQPAPVR
ncbi:M56 family metallopeptidase [Lysobacter terrae]